MDDLENYCFHICMSQGMSYLRAGRSNYDNVLILRLVALSSRNYLETQIVILMSRYGVLWFDFHINVDRGDF